MPIKGKLPQNVLHSKSKAALEAQWLAREGWQE